MHPLDNRIFILVNDGVIKVLDPNTYAVLHSTTYPASGAGYYLKFFSNNTKYIIGGYDITFPKFHIYNASTYAVIAGGATTTFTSTEQITVTSVSRDSSLIAAISSINTSPIPFLLYNLNTNTLSQSFTDNADLLKWILFSPFEDKFYVAANDMTIKCYVLNPLNSKYTISYSYGTIDYGYPNALAISLSTSLKDILVFSANDSIIFLNTSSTYPKL